MIVNTDVASRKLTSSISGVINSIALPWYAVQVWKWSKNNCKTITHQVTLNKRLVLPRMTESRQFEGNDCCTSEGMDESFSRAKQQRTVGEMKSKVNKQWSDHYSLQWRKSDFVK